MDTCLALKVSLTKSFVANNNILTTTFQIKGLSLEIDPHKTKEF
jgi:hypothetical protein